jgi:uncharacterized phage infection (PIP) family protein YhgE
MKETLENLDIDIEASEEVNEELVEKKLTVDEIPWDPEENPDVLTEDTDEEETSEEEVEAEEVEAIEEIPEEPIEEPVGESEEVIVDVDSSEEVTVNTVADAIEQLQEYDDETEVQFEPIEIEGKEYNIDKLETFVDEEENILVVGVNCEEAEENSDDTDSNIEAQPEETPVETVDSAEDENESAEDAGDEEVIESLKEMVRQKEALETEISDLRKAKSVGDAKEKELQEKLNRYRTAFRTTSAEAAKVPELQSKVKELTEQLTQAQNNVKTLTEKVNKAQQLKESIEGNKANERRLTEEVSKLTKKSEALEAKLEGQTKQYSVKLKERTDLAKKYKARFIETLTKYVESKANMLGVKPSEITSRLNESYTLADVDAVCNEILESATPFSRLPFGGRAKVPARITESVSKKTPDYDDDLSSLYELAGLKK